MQINSDVGEYFRAKNRKLYKDNVQEKRNIFVYKRIYLNLLSKGSKVKKHNNLFLLHNVILIIMQKYSLPSLQVRYVRFSKQVVHYLIPKLLLRGLTTMGYIYLQEEKA